jgi:hypothetical protein
MGDHATDHKMEEDIAMGNPAGAAEKGKGKAAEHPEFSMDEDSSEEEESGAENEVRPSHCAPAVVVSQFANNSTPLQAVEGNTTNALRPGEQLTDWPYS